MPAIKSNTRELLTVSEYAQLAKIHEVTVRRLIYAGTIPAVRIGRAVRIPAEALDPANLPTALGEVRA